MNVEKCARDIIEELGDRKGFNGWWDDIDDDVREEIVEAVAEIVKKALCEVTKK